MKRVAQSVLKLIAIKANNKVFISDNIDNESYFRSNIEHKYFDGELPKKTYKKDWFELPAIPNKIESKRPKTQINARYELKDGFPESDITPKLIKAADYDEDLYYDVRGLYNYKYEEQEEGYKEVEFEINIIEEIGGNFEMTKTQYNPKYNLLDQIQTHEVLLHNKPCKLSKQESYNIVRKHIKENINPKVAEITSDYDFCLAVKKKIPLAEEESYQVNVNASYPRRKAKYETRYQRNRTVEIFNTAPKPYQSYNVMKEFEGKTYEDLEVNIKNYLEELMKVINEPLVECKCCKGKGVEVNENYFK